HAGARSKRSVAVAEGRLDGPQEVDHRIQSRIAVEVGEVDLPRRPLPRIEERRDDRGTMAAAAFVQERLQRRGGFVAGRRDDIRSSVAVEVPDRDAEGGVRGSESWQPSAEPPPAIAQSNHDPALARAQRNDIDASVAVHVGQLEPEEVHIHLGDDTGTERAVPEAGYHQQSNTE